MLDRFVLAFALLAASFPAAADPQSTNPDPYSPDRKKITLSEDQARKYMDDFARCIASRQPKRAAAVLAMPYGSIEQQKTVRDLAIDEVDCLGPMTGSMEFATLAQPLTAGMAEYFVANQGKLADMRRRYPQSFAYAEPVGIEMFGECVVAQNPSAGQALAKSAIASDAETTATDALTPELQQCVSEGQTLELDRTALRELLAVSLYKHIAMPPPAPAVTTAATQH